MCALTSLPSGRVNREVILLNGLVLGQPYREIETWTLASSINSLGQLTDIDNERYPEVYGSRVETRDVPSQEDEIVPEDFS